MIKWKAQCPKCGEVRIAQKTKPTSCKTAVPVGPINVRQCRERLTEVVQEVPDAS